MPAHANCDLANFVDGEWLDADGREDEEVVNPATGETLAVLPHASEADLERATAAAARMLPQWHSAPAFERSKVLRKAADLLRERVERIATSMTLEQGKTIAESRMEILASADVIDWSAEGARRTCGRVIPERHSRLDDRTSGNGRRYPDRRCNGPLPGKSSLRTSVPRVHCRSGQAICFPSPRAPVSDRPFNGGQDLGTTDTETDPATIDDAMARQRDPVSIHQEATFFRTDAQGLGTV